MPAFVAALVVAPSLSSSSPGSSTLFARSRSPSSISHDRRASISGGLAQPYRHSTPSLESSLSSVKSNTPAIFPLRVPGFGSRPSSPGGGRKSSGGRTRAQRPTTAESIGSASFPSIDVARPTVTHAYDGRGHKAYDQSLIKALREGGIPVSSLRSTSQIQSHISLSIPLPPTPTSPSPLVEFTQPFSLPSSPDASSSSNWSPSSSGTPPSQAFILLLPLNDLAPSTLATARLIKESGKTPSSICFDLEHEVGEKEWERTFVEALAVIEDVEKKRGGWGKEVVVVAYSANPEISADNIERCRRAGADAVLYPPFDGSSATIEQLQRALSSRRDSFSSFSFKTAPPKPASNAHSPHPLSHLTSPPDTPPSPSFSTATLPPSSSFSDSAPPSLRRPGMPPSSFTSFQFSNPPANPEATVFAPLCGADPAGPRRTSVDTGGLALALERAQKLEDEGLEEGAQDGEEDTVLAELLSEMHRQTRLAVDGRMEGFPSPLTEQRRRELIQEMSTWGFQPHKLSGDDLYHCSCILFEATLTMEGLWELNIPLDQIHRFLFCVRRIYHAPNPYHNWVHATDVLQASYSFLAAVGVVPSFEELLSTTTGRPEQPWRRAPSAAGAGGREERAKEVLRPQDAFALVIAAIGHDVAHPGLSNMFMKNAKTPISRVYSDSSVLENMHCMLITSLLRKHGFDFLFPPYRSTPSAALRSTPPSSASTIDWTDFRTILFSSILATDMAMHFGWIRTIVELGERLERLEREREGLEEPEEEEGMVRPSEQELVCRDRVRLCQAILKCADISNPTRPHEVSKHWSTVLLEEWSNQAELESGLHLPVSVIKDADAALQAKGQLGFLDLFVYPLFTATAAVLPQLSIYATYSSDNRAIWADRLASLTADPEAPSIPIPPSSSFSVSPNLSDSDSSNSNFNDPTSGYRSLFPLTLPPSLLAAGGGGDDSVSSDGSASSQATISGRRTMQAGKRGGVELGSVRKSGQTSRKARAESLNSEGWPPTR